MASCESYPAGHAMPGSLAPKYHPRAGELHPPPWSVRDPKSKNPNGRDSWDSCGMKWWWWWWWWWWWLVIIIIITQLLIIMLLLIDTWWRSFPVFPNSIWLIVPKSMFALSESRLKQPIVLGTQWLDLFLWKSLALVPSIRESQPPQVSRHPTQLEDYESFMSMCFWWASSSFSS